MTRTTRLASSAVSLCAVVALAGCGNSAAPASSQQPQATATVTATVTPAASSSARPASSGGPTGTITSPAVTAASRLTFAGIGPYRVGTTLGQLRRTGLVAPGRCDALWAPTTAAQELGVTGLSFSGQSDSSTLTGVRLDGKGVATASGVRVGQRLAQAFDTYSTLAFTKKTSENGGPYQVATLRQGSQEILFLTDTLDGANESEWRAGTITSIELRPAVGWMSGSDAC